MRGARLGILISGGGRHALNIHESCRSGLLAAEVAIVIAHREEAPGVERCRRAGLRVAIIPPGEGLADRIDLALEAAGVGIVCLAGYLRHFRVGDRWRGRTLNIHPSLLPDFGGHGMFGARVHAAVLAAGRRESGCTVHEVDEEYDRGPVVLQRTCAVLPDDSVESLAARVFELERIAYPEAIGLLLSRTPVSDAAPAPTR
jgi:phosphoribosylglycinamide formyltransferase-1